MATATVRRPNELLDRARSPVVRTILENLDRRSWTNIADLVAAVGNLIPVDKALEVYNQRCKSKRTENKKTMVYRGRTMQVRLDCITLVHYNKIEQRGRGKEKDYRLV